MECPFCSKQLNIKDCNHIYKCSENKETDKMITRFLFISHNYPQLCDKDEMVNFYEGELMSLPDFKKTFGISYKNTLFLLDYYGIKKRNIQESCFLISKNKYKKTCREKYGVNNVSQLKEKKRKKQKTFLKNYGVDNIWKSKEYYEWLHDYMQSTYGKKSLPNRFGKMDEYYKTQSEENKKNKMIPANNAYKIFWANLSDEEKTKYIQKRNKFVTPKTESKVAEILNSLNVSYTTQYWINRMSYDFKINNSNLIIEVNGDFWHGNPDIYKANDILNHPFKKTKAEELWKKDERKRISAEKKGYKVVYIWEKELKENRNDLLNFIIQKLS